VLGVVAVGRLAVHGALVHGDDPQALALVSREDLPDQPAAYGVGLDQDQGALAHGPGA
jgi:hypothetical protein